jgi:hypothetical protein
LKKNKLILSGLFLTTAISCSAYRPIVLNAYLNPESSTIVNYQDLDFQTALFNQYASGLTYELTLDYSSFYSNQLNAFALITPSGFENFSAWDTVTSTKATAVLDSSYRSKINNILFGRQFSRTTNKADPQYYIEFVKHPLANVNLEIKLISKIKYNVNVGSLYAAFSNNIGNNMNSFQMFISFFNGTQKLQDVLLWDTNLSAAQRDYLFNLSTVITNVDTFVINIQYVDTPPFTTQFSTWQIYELNLFTQQSQIAIPEDIDGDTFGFEFVAVEWWNILGHLQNFAWWIVNKSPVAPIFQWIDTYIISWISGLVDILVGVFDL